MFTLKKSIMKYKGTDGNMQDIGAMCSVQETDTTLTRSGIPADSKIVGDNLVRLSEEKVDGVGIKNIVKMSQAEYDSMGSHDAETLYVIVG